MLGHSPGIQPSPTGDGGLLLGQLRDQFAAASRHNVKAKGRICHLTHKVLGDLLTGTGLKYLSTRFEANLRNQFSDDEIGHECQEFPDLYLYV